MSNYLDFFNTFLTDEDNSTITNANGDYGITEKRFNYTNDNDGFIIINRMIIFVEDKKNFRIDRYGQGVTLTNGIKFEGLLRNRLFKIISEHCPVKTNGDWAKYSDIVNFYDKSPIDQEYMQVVWTFRESIKLAPGDNLYIILNDNFTDLEKHTFQIQGVQ